MRNLLNKHLSYKSHPNILYNYNGIVKEISEGPVVNGIGLKSRLYISINNKKILLPTVLHPMIFSAASDDSPYVIGSNNDKQNGPFADVECTKWIQNFAVISARILEGENSSDLYAELEKLNKEDLNKHGRIGEGLYILFDMVKARKDGIKYTSPSISEYKLFIADLQKISLRKDPSNNGYVKDLPASLKNILTATNGAAYKYSMAQFPKMVKPYPNVSYYNLSKNYIDNSILPKEYNKDFDEKISDTNFIARSNLTQMNTLHYQIKESKSSPELKKISISDRTLSFFISTLITSLTGISTLSFAIFNLVSISEVIGFSIIAAAGVLSIASVGSLVYDNKKPKNNDVSTLESESVVEDIKAQKEELSTETESHKESWVIKNAKTSENDISR